MNWKEKCKIFAMDMLVYWPTFTVLLTPVIFLPMVLVLNNDAASCGYTICVMTVFWVSEVLPLPITALIPIVFFPLLGVMKAKDVAMLYLQDTSWVFMGGLMIGLAIERCNLHRRFGIGILLLIGCTPSRVLVGFMLPTWFLSMWISNSATTAMMIPVAEAVIMQYGEGVRAASRRKETLSQSNRANSIKLAEEKQNGGPMHLEQHENININAAYEVEEEKIEIETNSNSTEEDTMEDEEDDERREAKEAMEKRIRTMAKALCIAVAYSANIGGTATMTGSSTNLVVVQGVTDAFAKYGYKSPLNYATWLFFGLPLSIICQIACWLWLQLFFLGWRSFSCNKKFNNNKEEECIRNIMTVEYKKLGKIKFGEISTACLLVLMVLLWLTRDPGFVPGYASLFKPDYVTDSVPAIFVSLILFFYPSEIPQWLCLRKDKSIPAKRVPALLDWETVSTKLPWGPVFLLGGGFALAEGCEVSGLSNLIGDALSSFSSVAPWVLGLIVTIVIALVTEIMSNTAVIALFMPIIAAMADNFGVNPLYFMLPAGMAASYAFLLPIATPPNAIVFSYGHLKTLDMIKAGVLITIICIILVTLATNSWGVAIFDLREVPWQQDLTTNYTNNYTTIF